MSTSNAALVEMWRNNLRKSRIAPAVARRANETPAVISIVFDGVSIPPTVGMSGMVEIRFPCRILACHMYAGNATLQPIAVTATVDLRLGTQGAWSSGSSPLWGATIPTITTASEADIDITDWTVNLEPGDLVPFRLASFTGGSATWLAVSLPIRRLDLAGTSTAVISDSFGDELTTTDGEEIILRT